MKVVLLVVVAAVVSVLAFPPYGPGFTILAGVALFLTALRKVTSRAAGFWIGFAYGTLFIGMHMWWLVRLDWAALMLAPGQGLFFGWLGWFVVGRNHLPSHIWVVVSVGAWSLMELIRYRIPYGGMEWGGAGYALSDMAFTRLPAPVIGTSGMTVLVVVAASLLACSFTRSFSRRLWSLAAGAAGIFLLAILPGMIDPPPDVDPMTAAIVQGSTPCPFERCPPDQRFHTYQQHLELTRSIPVGTVDLVVWPEGSLGAFNADPVNSPEVGAAIGGEARRLGAWVLAGTDRPISDTHWVNANVLFNPEGQIVGEYHKQLPVPFGEFIPFRPFFTRLVPELYRVPRDMIPGDGPVVFDLDTTTLGSVISWEGGFSRFARQHVREGARLMVVATNNDSYGADAPTSEIFIGMTRMRAAELGMYVVHGAVTGRSVIIDDSGRFITPMSTGGGQEILQAQVIPRPPSIYASVGDVLMIGFALGGVLLWWRTRTLVVSLPLSEEEE